MIEQEYNIERYPENPIEIREDKVNYKKVLLVTCAFSALALYQCTDHALSDDNKSGILYGLSVSTLLFTVFTYEYGKKVYASAKKAYKEAVLILAPIQILPHDSHSGLL